MCILSLTLTCLLVLLQGEEAPFAAAMGTMAQELSETAFGVTLLHVIGYVYETAGSKHVGRMTGYGLDGHLISARQKAHIFSTKFAAARDMAKAAYRTRVAQTAEQQAQLAASAAQPEAAAATAAAQAAEAAAAGDTSFSGAASVAAQEAAASVAAKESATRQADMMLGFMEVGGLRLPLAALVSMYALSEVGGLLPSPQTKMCRR